LLYADYEEWLRNELSDWARGVLFDGCLAERGIFNEAMVRSLLERHFSGREVLTIGKIAPIMTFEMMLQRYLHPSRVGTNSE
jgi:asparagine synthase (glutamine-hydrolysing)